VTGKNSLAYLSVRKTKKFCEIAAQDEAYLLHFLLKKIFEGDALGVSLAPQHLAQQHSAQRHSALRHLAE
jgi:hypothetical protein